MKETKSDPFASHLTKMLDKRAGMKPKEMSAKCWRYYKNHVAFASGAGGMFGYPEMKDYLPGGETAKLIAKGKCPLY